MRSERSKKRRAVSDKTTPKNTQHKRNYHNPLEKSNVKIRQRLSEQLGELLLFLQNPLLGQEERRQSWLLFESSLRRYAGLRFSGVAL